MLQIRPGLLALFALTPWLSGCIRSLGDEPDFPEPISSSACPELSGTFQYQPDPESQGAWTEIIRYRDELGGAVTAVSLFDQPGRHALTFVLHRDPAEFARAIADLRALRSGAYSEWRRQALALSDPMRSALKVRRELPFDALTRHGPVPEWGTHDTKGHCVNGWYRDTRPYDAEIWLTRDVKGGLLVRFEKTERKMISLWAETGAGIPYAIHTYSRWARFSPAAVPEVWRPTAVNLPAVVAAASTGDPAGFMQKDQDARVGELRSRARKLMGADSMLLNFKEEGDRVLFTGTVADRATLDDLMAALRKERSVARTQLESTMDMSFGRVRFVVYITMPRR